jgi:hypothetical protein
LRFIDFQDFHGYSLIVAWIEVDTFVQRVSCMFIDVAMGFIDVCNEFMEDARDLPLSGLHPSLLPVGTSHPTPLPAEFPTSCEGVVFS